MKKIQIVAAALVFGAVTPSMLADTWNKRTKVTFSAPFQIPAPNSSAGVVSLAPGTYVFKLVDSSSDRHIVQVLNERENKVYSTILAIPDYRLNATSKTVMYFTERKAGAPMAIKSWFYPGDNFGQRFVYPKVKAMEIAAAINQPVPSHSVEVIERTKYVQVPVYIVTPAKQETKYEAKAFDTHDAKDSAGEDGEAVKQPAAAAEQSSSAPAETLPKTASPVPFFGVLGVLLLAASWLIRRVSAQLS